RGRRSPGRKRPGSRSRAWSNNLSVDRQVVKYGNQIKLTPHSGCQWGKIILHADFLDQTIVEFVQALHEHFRLAEHRHEVRVTIPPRHDMPVEMAGKARPRGFPHI